MNQQTITIPPATREEYRLVFALARLAVGNDRAGLAAINKVAIYQEALWVREQGAAGNETAPSVDGAM